MKKKKKGIRKFLALFLGMVLVSGSVLQPLSGVWVSKAANDFMQNHIIHRVMDEQTGDVWHYHYEDAWGNEVEPEIAAPQTSHSRRKAAKISGLPDRYDPRGTEDETPIRDQMDTGACWAFGALKSLEGNAITQGLYTTEEADFSENHLAWYTYRQLQDSTNPLYGDYLKTSDQGIFGNSDTIYDQGGNALWAAFSLANGWGAVEEQEAPFASGAEMTEAMEPLGDSIREHSVMRMTSVECYDEASRDEIKQAVLNNKAVDVSLYYPSTKREQERYLYQDEETCSLYSNVFGIDDANHCVTIVGWDDTYNTFCRQPEQSGAWLIANSYGEDYNDGGYFWVSYYDTSLCDYYSFQGVPADTYSTAFQYDGAGWGDGFYSEQDIRIANVFTNETEQPQELSAVSFYTYADNQSYEVQIYRNLGEKGPLDGEWVGRCTTEDVAVYGGYHTVSLQQPIIVAPGERFSVMVTFYPIGEFAYTLVEGKSSQDMAHYSGSDGQSYLFLAEEDDPKWYDTVKEGLNNVCVKALANPVTEDAYQEQEKDYVPSIPTPDPTKMPTPSPDQMQTAQPGVTPTQKPAPGMEGGNNGSTSGSNTTTGKTATQMPKIQCTSKITMGVGEDVKLQVQLRPASAKTAVTYQSNNTKVAKVQKNGRISGKKVGTAKITVNASGARKSVTVRVKKAPKSMKLAAKKKTLKKGKSCILRVQFRGNSASYSLKYKSMNPKIASVSSVGKVKAKRTGTVQIRVTSFNGKKAFIKMKVVS